jgi:DNA-binding NtrC family response regulator
VIITAYGDVPHAVRAMKLGAIDFLQKPLTPEALRSAVGEILGHHAKPAPHPNQLLPAAPNLFGFCDLPRLAGRPELQTV